MLKKMYHNKKILLSHLLFRKDKPNNKPTNMWKKKNLIFQNKKCEMKKKSFLLTNFISTWSLNSHFSCYLCYIVWPAFPSKFHWLSWNWRSSSRWLIELDSLFVKISQTFPALLWIQKSAGKSFLKFHKKWIELKSNKVSNHQPSVYSSRTFNSYRSQLTDLQLKSHLICCLNI